MTLSPDVGASLRPVVPSPLGTKRRSFASRLQIPGSRATGTPKNPNTDSAWQVPARTTPDRFRLASALPGRNRAAVFGPELLVDAGCGVHGTPSSTPAGIPAGGGFPRLEA